MTERNELTITISGATKSGKSTVAEAIHDALRAYGIEVRVHDEMLSLAWFEGQHKRLKALGEKRTVVTVKTVQINREAKSPHLVKVCGNCGREMWPNQPCICDPNHPEAVKERK